MAIDHLGIGVPDVEAARAYYDELMPLVGYQPAFGNGYAPTDWQGAQVFLYPALEEGAYSRHRTGLQHLAFLVPIRDDVHRVHAWVEARGDTVIHAPRWFPEYGEHCYATFFSDPHGVMLEVLCHAPDDVAEGQR
jgi:catechol 2,3-dioxygenase-like lactoylglutathione lyase family enzyme